MKKSKIVKSLVGISVVSTMFAGCAKTENKVAQAGSKSNNIVKPDKIVWGLNFLLTDEDGRKELTNKFKELTGTELELFTPVSNQFFEKIDTAFASGTAPDVISAGSNLSKYASTKVLLDLDKYFKTSENAKKIKSEVLDAIKLDGKIYSVPNESYNGTVDYIRKDWLDKLGLKPPKTYDEYYNMLKKFKTLKVDGKEVTPVTAAGIMSVNYLVDFYQDARPDFTEKNGKWVDGFTEPEMKGALERLRNAYKDGLLDQQIFTNKTTDCRDKFYSGSVGVWNYWVGPWGDTLKAGLKAGPEGKNGADVISNEALANVKYIARTPSSVSINAKAKNPDGIWNTFFETMLDGGEGSRLFTSGVENVHYKPSDNNKLKALPMKTNPNATYQKIFFADFSYPVPLKYSHEQSKDVQDSISRLSNNVVLDKFIPMSTTRTKKAGDIQVLREGLIADVVRGSKTYDEAIKIYNSKADENQISKILEEINK